MPASRHQGVAPRRWPWRALVAAARPSAPVDSRAAPKPGQPSQEGAEERARWRSSSEANRKQKRPNVIVVMTDDQDASMVGLSSTVRLIGAQRDDLHQQLRLLPALLPLAGDLPHRAVRAQPRRHLDRAAQRLQRPQPRQHPRRLAAQRRLPDRDGRQVPERLRDRRRHPRAGPRRAGDPAGLERVVRAHRRQRPAPLPLLAEREREDRQVQGRPEELRHRRARREGDRLRQAQTPRSRSRSSSGSTRPRPTARRARPSAPPATRPPRAPPRAAIEGSSARAPRTSTRTDVSDKPQQVQNAPKLGAAEILDIDLRYRGRVESLLSVDEAVKRLFARLRKARDLRQDLHRLHLGQRPADGRAPAAAEELPLRGGHPRAADDPGPALPRGRRAQPARHQRRPRSDDRRADQGDARPDDGRALAAGPGRRAPASGSAARSCSRRPATTGGSAAASGSTSSAERATRRALRPEPTPSSWRTSWASSPRSRRRGHGGPARGAAGPAPELRRGELPLARPGAAPSSSSFRPIASARALTPLIGRT